VALIGGERDNPNMQTTTPAKPRPASTVLLLRDGLDTGLEVFMVERHHKMGFAAAARVFPGGRVDDADIEHADDTAGAFRIAAIRETFEESGILLARPRGQSDLIPPDHLKQLQPARPAVNTGDLKFTDLLNRENLTLASDLLVPFAHWITPVTYPKRYDTHFFVARAPKEHIGEHDGHESVDSLWISPNQALSDTDAGQGKLEFPTRRNLEKLSRWKDTATALSAAKNAKIVTVLPVFGDSEDKDILIIPAEADYGGTTFSVSK
jgi:8-oxo-dGTP pyrophosphatase MutT (NUDIX family)